MVQDSPEEEDRKEDSGSEESREINTGGGAFVGGQVTVGGNLIGRDQIIQGDSIQGDVIGGDKITVGDVTDSQGIAVGREANAEVQSTLTIQDAEQLFLPLRKTLLRHSGADRNQLKVLLAELIAESAGGDSDSNRLAELLETIIGVEPDAASTLYKLFSSPPLVQRFGRSYADQIRRSSDL